MYGYDNYQKVKDILQKRREKAMDDAQIRQNSVAEQSEDFRIVTEELKKSGLLIFKTALNGGDIEKIKERNQFLNREKRRILKQLGYDENYTDIKYTCPVCNDTGYDMDKLCSCLKELLIKENIKSSGMGELIEKQSFENFDLDFYRGDEENFKRMAYNKKCAEKFAKSIGKNSKNLLLIGSTGTGKTHISTSSAKVAIEEGFEVLYDSAQNIVSAFEDDRFRSGYGHSESKGAKFLQCDLLIIDDLGTEFVNQFTISCLYNLINTRMNKNLSTVISTNLSSEELARRYEDRIYSRLIGSDSTVLLFRGSDHRLKR